MSKENKMNAKTLYKLIEQEIENIEKLNAYNVRRINENDKPVSGKKVYDLVLGQFKAPTEQAGKLGTDERIIFQKYISRNIKGDTLADKVDSINEAAAGEIDSRAPISRILGSLGALKMLQQTLDDFNESTAGFLFEAFLSALLGGKQVTERVGGTLPIEDCMFFVDPKTGAGGQPVSLKLLSTTTIIEGSLVNMLSFFRRPEIAQVANEKGIEYIVAVKAKGDELDIYSFNLRPDNFFHWIKEDYFDWWELDAALKTIELELAGAEEEKEEEPIGDLQEAKEDLNKPEVIKRNAHKWATIVKNHRFPMMGLPPDTEFNFDKWTGGHLNWKYIIPWPRAGKHSLDTAMIMLSDLAKQRFEEFKRGKFAPTNIEDLEIDPELEAQFLQDEDPAMKSQAAKIIATLGKKRKSAYLEGIETWGLRATESPIHVQRYYAILNPRQGELSAVNAANQLRELIEQGPDGVIKWASALEKIRKKTQFHIRPIRVRQEGTVYGTIKLSKRSIYNSIAKYSDRLEEICVPIYEMLKQFTDHVNGFYFQNRTGDAFKAAEDAASLADRTQLLVEEVEEK